MKAEHVKVWTDALRSGEYTQGREQLRYGKSIGDERHCCLGVLCDLVAKGKIDAGKPGRWGDDEVFYFDVYSALHMPPSWMMDALGLCPSEAEALAGRNDEGVSFDTIAEYIERNLVT